jgi:hypothetical protein
MRELGGHHELRRSNEQIAGSSDRSFGLVFAGFFALLALHGWWRAGRSWPIELAIAATFLGAALLQPTLLRRPNRAWTRLGFILGFIVTPLIMALLFFLVITPVGLLMRMFGKDSLRLRGPRQGDSYWVVRDPPGPSGESMNEQF